MEGNSRFDSSAASPVELAFKGTFPNGQRRNSMNGSLDRSASFREGNEGQMLTSGSTVSRGNYASTGDSAPVAQCLLLDPITMGDQKYTRSGELRRVLEISVGNMQEDCAFGAGNLKPQPPVATEELKQFKANMEEASVKARSRSKILDESIHKLNKCWEALNSKRQLRNEILPNERLGGSHFLKMGSQKHRSPTEFVNQRLEDRHKNSILNKRIRTSVAEARAEGQSNSFMRQTLAVGKDKDSTKNGSTNCDVVEEKIRRVPVSEETCEKKMKRKRSMGTVFARSVEGEGELKRVMHLKLTNDSGPQSSDGQGLRSGYSASNSKLDLASLSPCSNAYANAKNEQENISRDSMDGLNKERVVLKGNKFSVCDNNYTGRIYTLTKGKASRAPRTGLLLDGKPSSVSRSSETLEAWEQSSNVNRPLSVSGTVNPQRPLPAGSNSSSMVQWVGQRPPKSSRTRRANMVSPVLNYDEVQIPLEGCSPSDADPRMTSTTVNGSLISKDAVNSIQEGRVKHEGVSSPTRLSEREESGSGENGVSKLNENGLGSNEVDERAINNSSNRNSPVLATKNKKLPCKEEIGDVLHRQGRSSRGPFILKTGISPVKDKLEISTLTKPIRSMKPVYEENGSKSGRPPLKKSGDRKASARIRLPLSSDSPYIAGHSDDDREELLAAANFANNASYVGCSNSFWKKLEPYFAPVNLEDIAYLKQLVKSAEDDQRCLSQILGLGNDALDGPTHYDNHQSQNHLSRERERNILNQTDSIEIPSMADRSDQHLDVSFLCKQMDSEENKVVPLYQRVLTALIIDDQTEEVTVGDGNMSFLFERDDYQSSIRTECDFKFDMLSCIGNASFTSGTNIHDHQVDDFSPVHQGPLHPGADGWSILSENYCGGLLAMDRISRSSSFNCHFEGASVEKELLMELQSVGLYSQPVPGLADGECEAINQDIIELQKGLHQQVTKKREYFMKLIQAVEGGREMEQRALEQVAMEKLIELAYKKKLATRGSSAARNGLTKVARPVALAFMKRTLGRCRKFEETGSSCFLEPAIKDVLFAAPACLFPYKEQDVLGNLNNPCYLDNARTGPILNRGKKNEVLLDDVSGCGASLRSASTLGNSHMGGAKGKRSERERDKDPSVRNSVGKAGRSSSGYSRGERKSKAKPKQKAVQPSTSGNGFHSNLVENTGTEHQLAGGSNEVIRSDSNRKSKVESVSNGHDKTEEPVDFANLHELDSIEVGVANEFNDDQDLDSWLNIDEDGLPDNDAFGLDIPMDNLADLNMVL